MAVINRSRRVYWLLLFPLLVLLASLCLTTQAAGRPAGCEIRDGRLFVNGQWRFLKIAKPLVNFADPQAVEKFIGGLDRIKDLHYNCVELNCYWHYFDHDGDGEIDVSLEPLRRLIEAISARDMFPCLTVETYGVGGGMIPPDFFVRHPEARAINALGQPAIDSEYGFKTAVPSIFNIDYLQCSRRYIRNLTRALPHKQILHFETTVEPQYIGNQWLDFSPSARAAWTAWLKCTGRRGPAWPTSFPVSEAFLNDPAWLRFRAESLAGWISGDASAFRSVAGPDALVAVDYLETAGPEMARRNGDSRIFLENLEGVDILQVNWHWSLNERRPNLAAYENVARAMGEKGRHWAVSEHMTLNGSDFSPEQVAPMLRSTLIRGTLFGWEFVDVQPDSKFSFTLYEDDWTPKPTMACIDEHWADWVREIEQAAAAREARPSKP